MKNILTTGLIFLTVLVNAQNENDLSNKYVNAADILMGKEERITIGGYGQIDYNQQFSKDTRYNGKLDVHRLVMLFGYKFNERTKFITEIEYEHVKEVYIEQAFLQYKINNYINFRGGLLLVPMGIINEYHEPSTFNGVERPLIDKYIAPTTWREIGFGFTGNIIDASLKYQLYLINGFNGYDGDAHLSGKNGLRKGRQKGAESFVSSPNFTGKVEYYGIKSLNIGISGYVGNTQSSLLNKIDKSDDTAIEKADSSVVGVSMIGIDARYKISGLQLRGQLYYTSLSNTNKYNEFTTNDLGSSMTGFYIETGYNVFRFANSIDSELVPFIRLEQYNTHNTVDNNNTKNDAYNNTIITTGIGWNITPGSVLKADLQMIKSKADNDYSKTFNAGVAIMF